MAQKVDFDKLKAEGRLLFYAIRGSHSYGLNIETSDIDYLGVYVAKKEDLLGLGTNYVDMMQDEKGDSTCYEIGKFMNMLIKSSPNVLEALFLDDKFILYEHPLFAELKKHRNQFLTKDCFKSFIGYAVSEIKKARGLNKKCVQDPITKHLNPIDFCYTFYRQGSTEILKWLDYRHLKQEYCGLVKIPNMNDAYGLYYDFGNHMLHENWIDDDVFIETAMNYYHPNWFIRHSKYWAVKYLMNKCKPIGYRGIVGKDDDIYVENMVGSAKIYDLRLSSIEDKDIKPICYMSYNSNGYTSHCIKYKEYKEWVEHRNPVRFQDSQGKGFDRKNMAHCVRLLHMGIEIARDNEVHVNRENIDRDYILGIRRGECKYEELIEYVDNKLEEMKAVMEKSTLPEHVDTSLVNEILLKIRNSFDI